MTRIYANRPFARRMNVSAAIAVIAFFFGFWELWAARQAGEQGGGYGFLFGVLFIGGGVYALRQMLVEYAGTVVSIDAEGEGAGARAVISVWRPFAAKRFEGSLDRLTNWRFEARTERRGIYVPTLLADHPAQSGPLKLELSKGVVVTDELKALAPEAIAAFEKAPPA